LISAIHCRHTSNGRIQNERRRRNNHRRWWRRTGSETEAKERQASGGKTKGEEEIVDIADAYKPMAAIAGAIVLAFGAANYFQTKAEAQEAKQEVQKTVEELRAEVLLQRIKVLNDKPVLTANEKTELDLNLKQVAAIQAAGVKK
jgi:hypothetical protein